MMKLAVYRFQKWKFSSLLSQDGKTFTDFFKLLSVDFAIQWWYLCEFLENKNSKKSLNFFLPLSDILKISERKWETVKEQYII